MNIQDLPDVPELIRTEPRIEELIQVKTGFPVSPEFRAVLDKLTGFDQSFFTFTKENLVSLTQYLDPKAAQRWGYHYKFLLKREAEFLLPDPLDSRSPIRYFLVPVMQWQMNKARLRCPTLIWGLIWALLSRLQLSKPDIDLCAAIRIVFSAQDLSEMENGLCWLINGGIFDEHSCKCK